MTAKRNAPSLRVLEGKRETVGAAMAFTVIWYGKTGILAKTPFDAEKDARDHALSTFAERKRDDGVVAVKSARVAAKLFLATQAISDAGRT